MIGIEELDWRKASYSCSNGNCAEAASAGAVILVRDTKNRGGFVLAVPAGAWRAFTEAVKSA